MAYPAIVQLRRLYDSKTKNKVKGAGLHPRPKVRGFTPWMIKETCRQLQLTIQMCKVKAELNDVQKKLGGESGAPKIVSMLRAQKTDLLNEIAILMEQAREFTEEGPTSSASDALALTLEEIPASTAHAFFPPAQISTTRPLSGEPEVRVIERP